MHREEPPAVARLRWRWIYIDSLPDDLLPQILGFLPAEAAVQTCVLAKRWRNSCQSATGVRVVGDRGKLVGSLEKADQLVDHLLRSRDEGSSGVLLATFHIELLPGLWQEDDDPDVDAWFQRAVACGVHDLRFRMHLVDLEEYAHLQIQPPVSTPCLKKLDLYGLFLRSSFLDLSCVFPALEN